MAIDIEHENDCTDSIRIVAADSIQTKISDSQVPNNNMTDWGPPMLWLSPKHNQADDPEQQRANCKKLAWYKTMWYCSSGKCHPLNQLYNQL